MSPGRLAAYNVRASINSRCQCMWYCWTSALLYCASVAAMRFNVIIAFILDSRVCVAQEGLGTKVMFTQ